MLMNKENETYLDIKLCRTYRPYSTKEYIGRFLWSTFSPLFRWSPRFCFGWRRFMLRLFGAKIGNSVNIYPSAQIYLPWNLFIDEDSSIGEWAIIYNLGPIKIGRSVTISTRAHLCAGTHDYRDVSFPLLRLPINVCQDSWICAEAFVGPKVTIGRGDIVGARAVAVRDVEPWSIVVGNPARFLKYRPHT